MNGLGEGMGRVDGQLGVEAHTRNPRPGRRQQENVDLRSAGAI